MPRSNERQYQMNRAARQQSATNFVGSQLTKLFLGIHLFTSHPTWGAGDLTKNRATKYGKIRHRDEVYKDIGYTYLVTGVDEAIQDFVLAYHLSGIRRWRHFQRNFEVNVPRVRVPPARVPDLMLVEERLGYRFTDRGLLLQALTKTANPDEPCPTYDRLEYLGDAVLDQVATDLWIARGYDLRKLRDIVSESTCNKAWQAICIESGLWRYILGCDNNNNNNIAAMRAALESEKAQAPDSAYWKRVGK
ncbi:hypothetical protein BGX34_007614, partial [Mortierella sp. NVP85]